MKSEFDLAVPTSKSWKVPDVMATIGPTLEKPADLHQAIEAGARWFRLPCGYRRRPLVQAPLRLSPATAPRKCPRRPHSGRPTGHFGSIAPRLTIFAPPNRQHAGTEFVCGPARAILGSGSVRHRSRPGATHPDPPAWPGRTD